MYSIDDTHELEVTTCGLYDYSTLLLTRLHAWPKSRDGGCMLLFIFSFLAVMVKELMSGLNGGD